MAFTGYVVSNDGIQVDESKVSAIKTLPIRTFFMEVRSLNRLALFCKTFIRKLNTLMDPLT